MVHIRRSCSSDNARVYCYSFVDTEMLRLFQNLTPCRSQAFASDFMPSFARMD